MSKPNLLSHALLAALLAGLYAPQARSLTIDGFDDGTFAFSHTRSAQRREQQLGSMLGGARIVSLSTARRMTTVSASVAEGSSRLSFDTGTGPAGGLGAGDIVLSYGSGFFDLPQDPLGLDLSGNHHREIGRPSLQMILFGLGLLALRRDGIRVFRTNGR